MSDSLAASFYPAYQGFNPSIEAPERMGIGMLDDSEVLQPQGAFSDMDVATFAEGGEVSEAERRPGLMQRINTAIYENFVLPNERGMAADRRAKAEGIPGGAGGPRDAIRHMVGSSYTGPVGVFATEFLGGDTLNSLVGDNQATWDRANNALGQRLRDVPEGERYDRARNMVLQQLRHLVEYGEMNNALPSFDPNFRVVDRDAEGREIVYGPREIIGWIESGAMPRLSNESQVLRSDIYAPGSIGERIRPSNMRRNRGPAPASAFAFADGGLVDIPEDDPFLANNPARNYLRELNRADLERLPALSINTGFDRNRGVDLVPYGGSVRFDVPLTAEGDMLDVGAGYQGARVSGPGFRASRNLLREAGVGYTAPDGGRLSLDYYDRMAGDMGEGGRPDELHQDVRSPSDAEMMGRPTPSRGVRVGYRREFAAGGLVPLEGGGKVAIGPGGGLDDLIPTSINGRRAAALSDGEFVIPADVVSMMGDGSSNAGARRLYDLVRQVRQEKTGTSRQAGPLPVGEILKRSLS